MKTTFILIPLIILSFTLCLENDDSNDFSSSHYNSLKRLDKLNKLWSKINEDHSTNGWYSTLSFSKLYFSQMRTTFEHYSDTLPEGRNKLLFSIGAVAMVEFIADKDTTVNPYTGIFKGCNSAVLRFSISKQPDQTKIAASEAYNNFFPGLGIKFLRDNKHSANTVAMYSINGQSSWNILKNEFSNHIDSAKSVKLKLLETKFSEATSYTSQVGLMDLAQFDQFGKLYDDNIKSPFKLVFKPSKETKDLFTDHFTEDFITQLETIPIETTLYDTFALESPLSTPVQIGKLVIKQTFRASKWGDKHLFFKHEYMENDYIKHPEWLDPEILEDTEL